MLFDEMWRAPKIHLAAGAFIANETPIETVLMCMLLEQYKKIKYLEAKQNAALPEPSACVTGEYRQTSAGKQIEMIK